MWWKVPLVVPAAFRCWYCGMSGAHILGVYHSFVNVYRRKFLFFCFFLGDSALFLCSLLHCQAVCSVLCLGMLRYLFLLFSLLAASFSAAAKEVDYREIGRCVWVNESADKLHPLVRWDARQGCVAMGIGACPWFAAGRSGHAGDLFVRFVLFAESQGVQVPEMLKGSARWEDIADFNGDHSDLKQKMHNWLAEHLDIQARFLVARVHAALPAMLRMSHRSPHVAARYEELALSQAGLLCMADYLSFMGDGVGQDPQAAGLLQVLEEMHPTPPTGSAAAEFARAAAAVLQRQAKSAPVRKDSAAQLSLRLKRCRSYATGR